MRVARRVGTRLDTSAVAKMRREAAASASGFRAVTPKSWLAIHGEMASQGEETQRDSPEGLTERARADEGDDLSALAPSAMRIPISRVRCPTSAATTPKMPTAASTPARSANVARRRAENRRGAADAVTICGMVAACVTGWFGSIDATAARAADARRSGLAARSTRTMELSRN